MKLIEIKKNQPNKAIWCSVKEKLPQSDQICRVLNDRFEEEWIAWYDDHYQCFFDPDECIPIDVTHWKPYLYIA